MRSSKKLSLPHLLTLSLLLLLPSLPLRATGWANTSSPAGGLLPVGPAEYRPMEEAQDASGDPFQLCLLCRCCAAADPNDCSSMSCCFGIDCNLPDKPYGVCAFVPKTCNCTSCA